MAPSSPSNVSRLNSTSGLLAFLDLNERRNQNMEGMDIDQIMYVPDTPDRLSVQNINCGDFVEKDGTSSVAVHSVNSNFLDEGLSNRPRIGARMVGNGHNRRLRFRVRKDFSNPDESVHCANSIDHPLESSSSLNTHPVHRMVADKTFKHETNHSIGAQHKDKGKTPCSKISYKSSACLEDNAVLDSTGQNVHEQTTKKNFQHGAPTNFLANQMQEGSLAAGSCSSNSSNHACKKMDKVGDYICKGASSSVDRGKGVDFSSEFQLEAEKLVSAPLHATSHRVVGQKRLVRNGCISPHNINMAKQLAERHRNGAKDEHGDPRNTASNYPSHMINIGDSVTQDNNANKVKGKGILTHSCTSKELDAETIHLSSRSPIIHKEEDNRISVGRRVAFEESEGLCGWRSTGRRSRKINLPLPNGAGGHSWGNDRCFAVQNGNGVEKNANMSGSNNRTGFDYPGVQDAAQTASSRLSGSDRLNGRRVTSTLIKRQKKLGSTSSNPVECSPAVFDDSEIMFLGSSAEPHNSRSFRDQSCPRRGVLDPVIEIDELSPEIRQNDSHDIGFTNSDASDVRARQVEADEILARELQEQLYHEVPVSGGGEIDANIAWTLQQQEHAQHASSGGSHHDSHLRRSFTSQLYRQSQSRPNQNNPVRRGMQARAPASNRMAQLRRRFRGQPRTTVSRERIPHFPLYMDLEMRVDILEALEAAVSDISDMRVASNILEVQRDFNENDYEMLLALDENNHQHGGASVAQINSLPQSTVQTDNFEEACAICLETPTIGDTIRHLPCLHKFHKDCIDPWLSRKTSCPICKSSIT